MGNRKDYLKHSIVDICQRLDAKGFVANHDGNVSVRFDGNLLATPTAEAKVKITSEMIIMLDMQGKKLEGIGKPFSEIKLHLVAYRCREDAQVVVHAHPPFAFAKGMTGTSLEINSPEAVVSIGDVVPVSEFTMPGTPQSEVEVERMLALNDVFLSPGNGVFAVGRNLEEAYLRLELVEHMAKIEAYGKMFGNTRVLSSDEKQQLLDKRASIGLGPKRQIPSPAEPQMDQIKEMIAQELKKILKEN